MTLSNSGHPPSLHYLGNVVTTGRQPGQRPGVDMELALPEGETADNENALGHRRVKNDVRNATELAHRLRRNDLLEAWVAPPEVRQLRQLARCRAKVVTLRTSAKAEVHAVVAKQL